MKAQRVISVWFLKYLTSIPALLPLVALIVGVWFPELQRKAQAVAVAVGLDQYVITRSSNSEFFSAAYLYWWMLIIAIPACLVQMYRLANRLNVNGALCAIAASNLRTKVWDPSKWTMEGGRLRLWGALILGVALAFTGLFILKEPSFCKGCETSSLFGFILVNWLVMHAMLVYCHVMSVYIYFWKTLRSKIGEEE